MTARKPLIRTVSGAGLTEVQLSSSDLSDGPFAGTSNFTSVAAGLVPASGGGTTNFLRADGVWAPPSTSGVPYAATIGDGSSTTITVNHGLGTTDITVEVWELTGAKRCVTATTLIATVDSNHTSFGFTNAPASSSLRVVISPGNPASASSSVTGFTLLSANFPSTTNWTASKTAAAIAGNPWMSGARFWLAAENICITSPPGSAWTADIAHVAGGVGNGTLTTIMTRLTPSPSASWDYSASNALTYIDAMVAGAVSVMNSAGITNLLFDAENYNTTYLMFNFNQGAANTQALNSGSYTRAQACAYMQALGHKFGEAFWSRVPKGTIYLFFGASIVANFAGTPSGTKLTTYASNAAADTAYSTNAGYNMLPYFCLGLLDACPPDGHIVDYCEGSYGFAGQSALLRYMYASQNWVGNLFPDYTGLVAKCLKNWVPVPIIYLNCFFAALGTWYAGADFVTNTTDQASFFTRNALYCLQNTPNGYQPGIYCDGSLLGNTIDPWGQLGTPTNLASAYATCLNNAILLARGLTTWGALGLNMSTLYDTLKTDFTGRADYIFECS